jgi:UDP-N-acetylglucosamine transferase subunit ALG13
MKKVLVAPLNWGLGHATRCIPVINELLKQGAEVFIASDGNALQLLKLEFPTLSFFELPSYNITYGEGNNLVFKMLSIFKNTKKAIAAEHEALEKLIALNNFDLIISDNRYGIWNAKIHSVFITHQINIQVPSYLKWLQPILLNYNLKQISNFNECWIPDNEGAENLSGALSHQCKLPDNSYYIGLLSRFSVSSSQLAVGDGQASDKSLQSSVGNEQLPTANFLPPLDFQRLPTENCQLLIILSGPEPQRTIFEKIIISQINTISQKTLIVQGITETDVTKQLSEQVWITSYLKSTDLIERIKAAEVIVSRSGYSTVMDLAATNSKALLVPTPGQTEQEYLAKKLSEDGVFYSTKQDDFKLADIEKAKSFSGMYLKNNCEVLQTRIKKLLA